jgi:hypothetical protein
MHALRSCCYALIIFLVPGSMMGQIDSDPGCGTTPAQDQTGNLPFTMLQHVARGGREVTNQGTLRVLVVFVRFADDFDNGTNPDWNNFQILPAWAQTIVDPTVPSSGQQYTTLNLSNFFDRVSGGDGQGQHGMLQIVGDVYYVTTDSNREDYDNEEEVHRHVLEKLDNPSLYNVDFSLYDNWEFIQNGEFFTHQYRPGVGDGKVDYIFMNWRSLQMTGFAGYEGIKGLYLNYGGDFITNDGKRITHYSGSTQFGFITFLKRSVQSVRQPESKDHICSRTRVLPLCFWRLPLRAGRVRISTLQRWQC